MSTELQVVQSAVTVKLRASQQSVVAFMEQEKDLTFPASSTEDENDLEMFSSLMNSCPYVSGKFHTFTPVVFHQAFPTWLAVRYLQFLSQQHEWNAGSITVETLYSNDQTVTQQISLNSEGSIYLVTEHWLGDHLLSENETPINHSPE